MDEIIAFEKIEAKRARPWKGEEEVRLAWVAALEEATGVHFDAERAKKDSSYNNVIIEFKAPGLFKGSKSSAKFKEATEGRLLPYIKREAANTDLPPEDFIGIAIDGEHICFAQVIGAEIKCQHLIPFSPYGVDLVIQAVGAHVRKAITAENLLYDFGHGAKNARSLMQSLSDTLALEIQDTDGSKVKMLFEEWRTLYGQVADMSVGQAEAIEREISFTWNGHRKTSLPGKLFVIHTYNSLLIKLLAAEIVSAHGLTALEQPAQVMSALLDDDQLLQSLSSDIEGSGIFAQAGVSGFVEEAIFSWYLDAAKAPNHSKDILESLRRILASLSLYRTDRIRNTRDVLRDLYQGLVPSKMRHSLGEFYTPDWLVDFAVQKAQEGPWLHQRVLDPTCGSGAFLLAVIREKRREAEIEGWNSLQLLENLCSTVWGFDLNPLAVQTSRVNFLMEVADLLREAAGHQIEIPVLLADAIYSPAETPDGQEGIVNYRIGSQIAKLDIDLPVLLAQDRVRLDQFFEQMGADVESGRKYKEVEARLIRFKLATEDEMNAWRVPLCKTYNQILNLHKMNWNGIWFRIVRNFFWSATAGRFDVIVGNPPWVRWSKLPDAYRERVKPTCEQYGIFSKTKRHGGNELDISAMITYTTSDKWLRNGGRLVFLITGTVFKNPSSAGFRTFQIEPKNPNSLFLVPVSVDDMKGLKPFSDAANHTTVFVIRKSAEPGVYPIPYNLWRNREPYPRAIPEDLTLEEVNERVAIVEMEAAPVGEVGSPWAVLPPGRFGVIRALSGECAWIEGRKGITSDLNGVFFVRILDDDGHLLQIQSRPEAGKKDIGAPRTTWVEPDLLYPLLKGASDFEPFYLRLDNPGRAGERIMTFVPNRGINGRDYEECEDFMESPVMASTRAYFDAFGGLLERRSTYRRQMNGAPRYAVYNIGAYTFQPYKVVWPEMSTRFFAAVAGSSETPTEGLKPYIPDHKIYFASFDDPEPAHYLCGILNSSVVREWIESHIVNIQVGDIFKHLNVPPFDPTNTGHLALSEASARAHTEHDPDDRAAIIEEALEHADRIISRWLLERRTAV